jgi:hypothetical protein
MGAELRTELRAEWMHADAGGRWREGVALKGKPEAGWIATDIDSPRLTIRFEASF